MQSQGLSTPSEVIYGADTYLSTRGFAKYEKDLERIKYICQLFEDLGYSHMLFSVDFVRIHTDDAQHKGFDDFIKGVKNLCAMSLSQKLFQEGSQAEIIYTTVLSQTRSSPHSITNQALLKAKDTIKYVNQVLREHDIDNHIGPTKKDPNSSLGLVFRGTIEYQQKDIEPEKKMTEEFSQEACELFDSRVMRMIFDMMFIENGGRIIGIDTIATRILKLQIEIEGGVKGLLFEMQRIIDSRSNRFKLESSSNGGLFSLHDYLPNEEKSAKTFELQGNSFVGDTLEMKYTDIDERYSEALKTCVFMGVKLTPDEIIFCIIIDTSKKGALQGDFNPFFIDVITNSTGQLFSLMKSINDKYSQEGIPTRVSMTGLRFSFIELDLFSTGDSVIPCISLSDFPKN